MFNKKVLKTDLSNAIIYDKVKFVLYSINNTNINPFMVLYLFKDLSESINFPIYPCDNITESSCVEIVNNIFIYYKKYIEDICYSGYITDDHQLYVFYEIKWNTHEAEYIDDNSPIFPVLIDEILNTNSIYNINIHHEVTTFLLNNSDIVYLYSEYNLPIEYPIVTYNLNVYTKIQFMAMFGVSKDLEGRFGPYFYFKSYKKNIEELNNAIVTNKPHGILRCAIFTENITLDATEFIETNNDTLYCKDEYIIKNLQNQIPLTYKYIYSNK